MANLYRGTLNTSDVIGSSTVTLVPGQYVTIGELVVKADENIGMGFGAYDAQNTADGRIFIDLKDNSGTPAAIEGKFRIITLSSQNIPIGVKPVEIDMDLAALNQGAGNRTEQIAFPFQGTLLTRDKKYVFQVLNTAATAQTVSKANSNCLMDISRQLV